MTGATVLYLKLISDKYHYGYATLDQSDADGVLILRIEGDGVVPRAVPSPVTQEEMDEWMARLRVAGFTVTQQRLRGGISGSVDKSAGPRLV